MTQTVVMTDAEYELFQRFRAEQLAKTPDQRSFESSDYSFDDFLEEARERGTDWFTIEEALERLRKCMAVQSKKPNYIIRRRGFGLVPTSVNRLRKLMKGVYYETITSKSVSFRGREISSETRIGRGLLFSRIYPNDPSNGFARYEDLSLSQK